MQIDLETGEILEDGSEEDHLIAEAIDGQPCLFLAPSSVPKSA